jgi:hypothetical protein
MHEDANTESNASPDESYYIPMADLLAGILFILLILLMSFAIIHYPDDNSQPRSVLRPPQAGTVTSAANARQRLTAELVAARDEVLQRLARDLEGVGVDVTIDRVAGRLLFNSDVFFQKGERQLSQRGLRAATAVAATLADHFACRRNTGGCQTPADLVSYLAFEVYSNTSDRSGSEDITDETFAVSRAIGLLQQVTDRQPALLEVRNAERQSMLSAQGRAATPNQPLSQIELNVLMPFPPLLPSEVPLTR